MNQTTEAKPLSKAQQRVVNAMGLPKAYLVAPEDSPGKRTGYVTTGGLQGYICHVPLSTLKNLLKRGVLVNHNGNHELVKP